MTANFSKLTRVFQPKLTLIFDALSKYVYISLKIFSVFLYIAFTSPYKHAGCRNLWHLFYIDLAWKRGLLQCLFFIKNDMINLIWSFLSEIENSVVIFHSYTFRTICFCFFAQIWALSILHKGCLSYFVFQKHLSVKLLWYDLIQLGKGSESTPITFFRWSSISQLTFLMPRFQEGMITHNYTRFFIEPFESRKTSSMQSKHIIYRDIDLRENLKTDRKYKDIVNRKYFL